ncbi:uncharacterized protein N7479_006395 [Penicillium vulpinum]|uniref:uncharacterized protein n=1 Tax=Penicillium vulpinum TaxID=29845 RepID=UPI0025478A60|nr:uncharacterized protein N7479_006395 [Penicillium vulpinum]KAJ5959245.1 hypothetical protein N7479_006395 [Penicillium vulpinum]
MHLYKAFILVLAHLALSLALPVPSPKYAQQQPLPRPPRLSQLVSQHPPAQESTHPVSSAPRTTNAARATAPPPDVDRRILTGHLASKMGGLALSMHTAVMGIHA